jgi:hypothetical protein
MWKSEWEALSARIAAIVDAAGFLFQSVGTGTKDQPITTDTLLENCARTAKVVLSLEGYGKALPQKAWDALGRFKTLWANVKTPRGLIPSAQLQERVVVLASIRSELDHLLADHDEVIRSHVIRGFEHLQRSLIVDEHLQKRWLTAFRTSRKGETSCEQLGGVHLLLHGIWAFKASATGERTDLVLGTKLAVNQDVIASTHGLVLTEWKLIRKGDSAIKQKEEAKSQAKRYAGGSLVGFELASERYLVLVAEEEFAEKDIVQLGDEKDGQITYKVVPIVLNRTSPSVFARSRSRKST